MRRSVLLFGVLALAAANTANAQLTMQMSNGWTFAFAGNVNLFAQYQSVSAGGTAAPGGLTPAAKQRGFYYGTGLLPAFAIFTAAGKEGNTDLGVHFGFAPEAQCGYTHDCSASLDMRQIFLTVGGTWGQILAGKELGVFQRQNILNDQTLFGVGGNAGIAATGTTLGRIGYGYIYPNFVGQMTYSTPGGKPSQLSISLAEPSNFLGGGGETHDLPRLEAEATWKSGQLLLFASGEVENSKTAVTGGTSKTSVGAAGGVTFKGPMYSLHASGFWGKGLGSTFMFDGPFGTGSDGAGNLRTSYGFYGQATYTFGKSTLAGSYGSNYYKSNKNEVGKFKTENTLISAGLYYQATKSLKAVWEGNYSWTKESEAGGKKNKGFVGAFGLMLFY